jgi:hypothetical protein
MGLLINGNLCAEMNPNLQLALGFEDLTLLNVMNAYGSTPATMIQYALTAVEQDQANVVVLVYADAPLQPATSAGASYATDKGVYGMGGILNAHGCYGANPGYAMGLEVDRFYLDYDSGAPEHDQAFIVDDRDEFLFVFRDGASTWIHAVTGSGSLEILNELGDWTTYKFRASNRRPELDGIR